jgi:hypothetical protein
MLRRPIFSVLLRITRLHFQIYKKDDFNNSVLFYELFLVHKLKLLYRMALVNQ